MLQYYHDTRRMHAMHHHRLFKEAKSLFHGSISSATSADTRRRFLRNASCCQCTRQPRSRPPPGFRFPHCTPPSILTSHPIFPLYLYLLSQIHNAIARHRFFSCQSYLIPLPLTGNPHYLLLGRTALPNYLGLSSHAPVLVYRECSYIEKPLQVDGLHKCSY